MSNTFIQLDAFMQLYAHNYNFNNIGVGCYLLRYNMYDRIVINFLGNRETARRAAYMFIGFRSFMKIRIANDNSDSDSDNE